MRTLWSAFAICVMLTSLTPAMGAYVAYEGDVFPEQDGWTADGDPENPAIYTRSIQDGVLRIDATADGGATVIYYRDILIPSDYTYYEWRARTSNDDGGSGVSIRFEGPTGYSSVGAFWQDTLAWVEIDPRVPGHARQVAEIRLAPGEFHVFRLETLGACYSMYVDGQPALSDVVQPALGLNVRAQFTFIKNLQNSATRSEWDYIRIGEIPEPSTCLLMLLGFAYAGSRWRLGPASDMRRGDARRAPGNRTRNPWSVPLCVLIGATAALGFVSQAAVAQCSGIAVTRSYYMQTDQGPGCANIDQLHDEVTVDGGSVTFKPGVFDYANGSSYYYTIYSASSTPEPITVSGPWFSGIGSRNIAIKFADPGGSDPTSLTDVVVDLHYFKSSQIMVGSTVEGALQASH